VAVSSVDVTPGSGGTFTFDILGNPGMGSLAVSGLEDPALGALVGAGWSSGGGYYFSDYIVGTGPVTLDFTIDGDAPEGGYALDFQFAGQSGFWGSVYGTELNVVPEPATLMVFLTGAVGLMLWRRC